MNGIFGSAVLDVAVGLIFVYLLLGIICTTLNEWISGLLQTRSKMLQLAIQQLLDNQPRVPAAAQPAPAEGQNAPSPVAALTSASTFLQQFYNHPIISGMHQATAGRHFSYLPARAFSAVIMDLVTPGTQGRLDITVLENGIKAMPDGDVKRGLLAAIQNAGNSLEAAQRGIEAWFDDTMDRVSGWYKRNAQKWTVILAVAVTLCLNADTVHMARTLWMNPTLRAQIVEQSKTTAASAGSQVSSAEQKYLDSLVGWPGKTPEGIEWLERILGWIFTAIAVSLGAPFWFDTLNRFMNLRNAVKSPERTDTKFTAVAAAGEVVRTP